MYRGSRHLGKIDRSLPAHSSNFRRWSAERVDGRGASSGEKFGTFKAGGTISQQAVVHSWLATNAQQQQQAEEFDPSFLTVDISHVDGEQVAFWNSRLSLGRQITERFMKHIHWDIDGKACERIER
jgi:hypothetical protein